MTGKTDTDKVKAFTIRFWQCGESSNQGCTARIGVSLASDPACIIKEEAKSADGEVDALYCALINILVRYWPEINRAQVVAYSAEAVGSGTAAPLRANITIKYQDRLFEVSAVESGTVRAPLMVIAKALNQIIVQAITEIPRRYRLMEVAKVEAAAANQSS